MSKIKNAVNRENNKVIAKLNKHPDRVSNPVRVKHYKIELTR